MSCSGCGCRGGIHWLWRGDWGRGFGGSWVLCGSGRYLQEIESGGVCGEDLETFTEDPFEFRKAWIVGGDEGAEVGVVGGLSGLDGLRVEGTCVEDGAD